MCSMYCFFQDLTGDNVKWNKSISSYFHTFSWSIMYPMYCDIVSDVWSQKKVFLRPKLALFNKVEKKMQTFCSFCSIKTTIFSERLVTKNLEKRNRVIKVVMNISSKSIWVWSQLRLRNCNVADIKIENSKNRSQDSEVGSICMGILNTFWKSTGARSSIYVFGWHI